MRLVVFTAFVGLVCAPVTVHPVIGLAAIICIAVGAGACGRAQHVVGQRHRRGDGAGPRAGRSPRAGSARDEALAIGLALAGFSVVMLGLFANLVAAALLAFTIFFYVVVYSMWLKRATPQNIVIGGAAGALPPMIGWAVATGRRLGREPGDVRADLPLDAAAFLGAGALPQRRLRPRRGADAAGDGRAARRRRNHILGYAARAGRWRRWRRRSAAIGGPVYLAGALVLNALFAARRLAGLAARRGGGRGGPVPRRRGGSSASRSSI